MNYIIVTTLKNEELYVEKTIYSIINQTVQPIKWIIIDDNSTDHSYEIISKFISKYHYITLEKNNEIKLNEKGARIASIVDNAVKNTCLDDINIIIKLDADVTFKEDFIANIIGEFISNPKLGIASGILYYKGIREKILFPEYTRGAIKFYRRDCWNSINGLYHTTGWDTIDNESAMINGWETRTLNFPFNHLKEEGISQGVFKMYYTAGLYYGKIPYYWPYFILKLLYRIFQKPCFISSFITFWGYVKMRYLISDKPFPDELSLSIQNSQKKRIKNILTNFYVWNLWNN
jgi:glycosyltransferase involved in cell wall biosynthesis